MRNFLRFFSEAAEAATSRSSAPLTVSRSYFSKDFLKVMSLFHKPQIEEKKEDQQLFYSYKVRSVHLIA
jgi:hypothetical protein